MKFLNVSNIQTAAKVITILSILLAGSGIARAATPAPSLKVSTDGRFLVTTEGKPFFWLADTAWNIFNKLNPTEVDQYLLDRQKKGFNVIQAIVLQGAPQQQNIYGQTALLAKNPKLKISSTNSYDPTQPNEKYFQNMDVVINKANAKGMVVALVPTWAYNVTGNHLFTETSARAYGEYLGRRYKSSKIVWVLGGDQPATGYENIWRAMADGISKGDGGQSLKTYHTAIGTSAAWFHNDAWLSFNTIQSGHSRTRTVASAEYLMVASDYKLLPAKPVLDMESGYENIPSGLNQGRTNESFVPKSERLSDYDIRTKAYWSVFSGALGYTYGAYGVINFEQTKDVARWPDRVLWQNALAFPGSQQMLYLKVLMTNFGMNTRRPAPEIITSPTKYNYDRTFALQSSDKLYSLVYSSSGLPFTIDLSKTAAKKFVFVNWYNPRTGKIIKVPDLIRPTDKGFVLTKFIPPTSGPVFTNGIGIPENGMLAGNDWVLILRAF